MPLLPSLQLVLQFRWTFGTFPRYPVFAFDSFVLSTSEFSEGFPSDIDLIARSKLRVAMRKLYYQAFMNAEDL